MLSKKMGFVKVLLLVFILPAPPLYAEANSMQLNTFSKADVADADDADDADDVNENFPNL